MTFLIVLTITMVSKTGMVKEPEKYLITGFMVGLIRWKNRKNIELPVLWSDRGPTDGRTGDIINNLIKILK